MPRKGTRAHQLYDQRRANKECVECGAPMDRAGTRCTGCCARAAVNVENAKTKARAAVPDMARALGIPEGPTLASRRSTRG